MVQYYYNAMLYQIIVYH